MSGGMRTGCSKLEHACACSYGMRPCGGPMLLRVVAQPARVLEPLPQRTLGLVGRPERAVHAPKLLLRQSQRHARGLKAVQHLIVLARVL